MISREEVKYIADFLARLELTSEEEIKYSEQLSSILEYIDKLKTVDTSEVSSTFQVGGLSNVWREDEVSNWKPDEIAMALSQSELVGRQVKVKKVL
jgi:aspartyl-tRNA(Asn)/glutamyl-tRNA(Gln) amidotransferase subunit C